MGGLKNGLLPLGKLFGTTAITRFITSAMCISFCSILRVYITEVPDYANFFYPNVCSLCFDSLFINYVKTWGKIKMSQGQSTPLKMSLYSGDIRLTEFSVLKILATGINF